MDFLSCRIYSIPMPEELSPFEKMREAAKRVLAVPKEEMERREEQWRKEREKPSLKPQTPKPK